MSSRFIVTFRKAVHAFGSVLIPRYCPVCQRRLLDGEECLCISCIHNLPRTNYRGAVGNPMELQLSTLGPRFRRANSLMFYRRKSRFTHLIFSFKYNNQPQVAVHMGRFMAIDLRNTDFFDDITCIVPVPIAKKRIRQRGYNQSEMLARGIAEVTHLPIITTAVVRNHFHQTQTRLNSDARRKNVHDAFTLADASLLEGQHVLLVDDVITYGHTMRACAREVLKAEDCRVSVLTLATAYVRYMTRRPRHIHPWD